MGLSPEIRKRLQELNRGPLTFRQKNQDKQCAPDEPKSTCPPGKTPEPVVFEKANKGKLLTNSLGKSYLISKTYSKMIPGSSEFLSRFDKVFRLGTMAWRQDELHHELRPLLDISPKKVLYLDIETTGLSSMPVFLIGLMHYTGKDFRLLQYFARDYSEEAPMLQAVAEKIQEFDLLVTYNGKSFDAPFIRDRAIANGIELEFHGQHLDLLHEARRRWRGVLPNCKLQTLEQYLCKRLRVGDIPGALIPQAYHNFVHSGNASQVCDVLHHNALDLISMAEILLLMVDSSDTIES